MHEVCSFDDTTVRWLSFGHATFRISASNIGGDRQKVRPAAAATKTHATKYHSTFFLSHKSRVFDFVGPIESLDLLLLL